MVEFTIVKSSILKTLFICLYRPPDTKNQEWSQALETMSEQIELAQAHSNYQRIVMGGDVNFKDLKWDKDGYLDFEKHMTKQMEEFSVIITQNFLNNLVLKPTRGENILDLVLTNDPQSFMNIDMDYNAKFSDHYLVSIQTKLMIEHKKEVNNLNYLNCITEFNWRQGDEKDWKKYHDSIN